MVQWNCNFKGLVTWDLMLHQWVRGSTHFKQMCRHRLQVFKGHKQTISSWTLLQNTSDAVTHPIITPLQKTHNLQGTYLPSDIGHIIIGHPLISFIGIRTNPALWVSYWYISLWLNSVTYLLADDRIQQCQCQNNMQLTAVKVCHETTNPENHSPQINKAYK